MPRHQEVPLRAHLEKKELVVLPLLLKSRFAMQVRVHVTEGCQRRPKASLTKIEWTLRRESVRTNKELAGESGTVSKAAQVTELQSGIGAVRCEGDVDRLGCIHTGSVSDAAYV